MIQIVCRSGLAGDNHKADGTRRGIERSRDLSERHQVSRMSVICAWCIRDGVPRRSFAVALIVGAILNLINQGDRLLSGQSLDLSKLLLTYCVPYCVATYGAVSFRLRDANLRAESDSARRGRTR